MDSPVQIPFKSFIQLKPDDAQAIYLQLVFEFIKAIQLGLLPEGTQLPGTRVLCKLLSVNRNTLIKAFDDLQLQGFIEIRPNKGTFILSDQKQKFERGTVKKDNENLNSIPFTQSVILENPHELSDLPLQFNDGQPDIRLVNTDVLARLYVAKLKRKRNSTGLKEQLQLSLDFKHRFASFLNLTRGLRIAPSNILTTSNHEISLFLVAKLLFSQGDKVVVASPSYYRANMTLLDSGVELLTVPVDQDGLSTTHLKTLCEREKIKALYLNSNYHYPTTICLTAKRRMELLDLAHLYGFVIIEDDHDFDFHYDNNPLLPLAAISSHANVIYIGSFARSLPVGFGYGFVIASDPFIKELEKHKHILEPHTDLIKEQVLSSWIEDGEVHRLAKKNKKIYKERRDAFVNLLEQHFKGKIKYQIPTRGLGIWIEWLERFSLGKFKKACEKQGLFIPQTSLYQTKDMNAMRLGFGHLDLEEMAKAFSVIHSVASIRIQIPHSLE